MQKQTWGYVIWDKSQLLMTLGIPTLLVGYIVTEAFPNFIAVPIVGAVMFFVGVLGDGLGRVLGAINI